MVTSCSLNSRGSFTCLQILPKRYQAYPLSENLSLKLRPLVLTYNFYSTLSVSVDRSVTAIVSLVMLQVMPIVVSVTFFQELSCNAVISLEVKIMFTFYES